MQEKMNTPQQTSAEPAQTIKKKPDEGDYLEFEEV